MKICCERAIIANEHWYIEKGQLRAISNINQLRDWTNLKFSLFMKIAISEHCAMFTQKILLV